MKRKKIASNVSVAIQRAHRSEDGGFELYAKDFLVVYNHEKHQNLRVLLYINHRRIADSAIPPNGSARLALLVPEDELEDELADAQAPQAEKKPTATVGLSREDWQKVTVFFIYREKREKLETSVKFSAKNQERTMVRVS